MGSSFDDWLREEGHYEETTAVAIKRVLGRRNRAGRKIRTRITHQSAAATR